MMDISTFIDHISDYLYLDREKDGHWGILDKNVGPKWPIVLIWVKAKEKANSSEKYFFQFKLDGYPHKAPEICIWDIENNCQLDTASRPRGTGKVEMAFRVNWGEGKHLYAPYERHALETHSDWPLKYPSMYWKPKDTIVKILEDLYSILNSEDYHGNSQA